MKFKLLITTIISTLLITGCKTTPSYEAKKVDSNFTSGIQNEKKLGVVQFDAWVGDDLNGSGSALQLFGALGAIADSKTDKSEEAFGINLQNETVNALNTQISKVNPNFVSANLMERFSVEELTKRYKSNRLWGMGSVKSEQLTDYFNKNQNVDYAIHIKSQAAILVGNLLSDTEWVIYDKNLTKVAEISTRSVEELNGKKYTNEEQFKKVMSLQQKNITEFIKIISNNS
ncbi:hypothetical protein [Thalassotalea ganghwensis]